MNEQTSTARSSRSGRATGTRPDGQSVVVPEDGGREHPLAHGDDGAEQRWADQPTVELPSGSVMPAFGIGTWQLEGRDASDAVEAALGIGVRHVDTAQMYGNESDVGAAIAASGVDRGELFLTTKVANDAHEPSDLVASVESSLERLGLDHVDLLLLHWPVDFDRIGASLSTLAQVQASGRARHIGVSNFTADQLSQTADLAPIEVLQAECHPYFQQPELRDWCERHGWGFTAYSPLARGDVFDDEVLADIAEAHGASPGAVALAWLLAQPGVSAIPKTTDVDHLRDNWSALDVELGADDLDRIATLDEGRRLVDPDTAPW